MNYYIMGNGESRKDLDFDKLHQTGFIVGCNGIYLHENPKNIDLLCAMDKFWREKITKETDIPLLSRYNNTCFQTSLQIYDKKWENTTCLYRGYCSGTTALDYICSQHKQDDIYLLGFDFDYKGQFVNHIYKDTKFHPASNRPAQSSDLFLLETQQILKRYPKHNIYWVTDSDFQIKIKKLSINEYKEIAYAQDA